MLEYDAAVIGAGPAGTHAARKLAESGCRVIVLEKQQIPRYKPCAGGLTRKVINMLPDSIKPTIEDEIRSITFTHKAEEPVKINFNAPIIYTVMRENFDAKLTKLAENSGARIISSSPVLEISSSHEAHLIKTANNEFKAKYIIGADGPGSLVRKSFPYRLQFEFAKAIEAEIIVDNNTLKNHRSKILLDYGRITHGYSWIFPKSTHLSIGCATFNRCENTLEKKLNEFIHFNCPGSPVFHTVKAHPIPNIKKVNFDLNSNNTLLVGDAAGLTDPLTGEGIYYALLSAEIAAQVIYESLKTNKGLKNYSRQVGETIIPEIMNAKNISRMIYRFTGAVHSKISENPHLAEKFLKAASAEGEYSSLFRTFDNL